MSFSLKFSRGAWIGVLVALAMIAIGVFVAIDLRKDLAAAVKTEQAKEDIRRIARALLAIYENKMPPRKEDLWRALELQGAPVDPWGNPYDVTFQAGEFSITTAGPDGRMGSGDDIQVSLPFGGNPSEVDAGQIPQDNAAPAP